jgi:8-oxo-dGTP pyrophosphatase MutT (NUDIX family)
MTLQERLARALAPSPDAVQTPFVDLRPDPSTPIGRFAPAAVLIPFTDRAAPGLILTQRPSRMSRHAGQVAFPGGRLDPEDADSVAGALREAREEIALPSDRVEIIGLMNRYRTGTGFDIEPVVGIVPPDLPLVPATGEVDAIFEVPLAYLLDPSNLAIKSMDWNGVERHYYEFLWEEFRIWGITAAITVDLLTRIARAEGLAEPIRR